VNHRRRDLDEERGQGGVKLIVADPRRGELARHATYNLQFKPTPTSRS